MKVLFISTFDIQGGAAIAATRLLHAMQGNGYDVSMIVRAKSGTNSTVFSPGNKKAHMMRFYGERAVIYFFNSLSRKNLFDISIANTGISITELPEFKKADVIHLHWINQGMLSVKEIDNILSSGKKVVWTMHDMWPFTGICHHAAGCDNYETSCGNCPYLKTNSHNDLSNKVFIKKHDAYSKGVITFVACSNWLKKLADKSPLTRAHRVVSIPNPIDTNIYYPNNNASIRKKLQLPTDKKIILFAAANTSDPRKGLEHLLQASHIIADKQDDVYFIVAGANSDSIVQQLPLPSKSMGYIAPDQMVEVYNAADLFVTPSLQENLPNTIMEAMACGIPCVGFNIGGVPEMINHNENGYVASYKDSEDFAKGILEVLFAGKLDIMSNRAREKVLKEYKQDIIANRYKDIYERE